MPIRTSCIRWALPTNNLTATGLLSRIVAVGRHKGLDQPHSTHFFLDEATQATEPASLIPMSVVVDPEPGSRKVELALVGLPRQPSPTIYSTAAAQAGLYRSWMERLLQRPIHSGVRPPALGVSSSAAAESDMLGPSLGQMDDWLTYSLIRDVQEQQTVFLDPQLSRPSCMPPQASNMILLTFFVLLTES